MKSKNIVLCDTNLLNLTVPIQKIIFLALTNASKKWTMPIKNWAMALNQFAILCDTNLQNWANGEIVLTQKI
ncbi:hypothetical protein BA173_01495 [Rickettsia sp. MEAM1 (Bemisia tabaci)]|nr:hypothetical protein BA173_01495 [Rickettsia sp. MEAM1 (Bemisia tabaci)]